MKISYVDRDGAAHELTLPPGQILMRVLRDEPRGVSGLCGGVMACGTCHIYVREDQLPLLAKPGAAEAEMLASLSGARANSRLSCQIYLRAALDGLAVEVAPEE